MTVISHINSHLKFPQMQLEGSLLIHSDNIMGSFAKNDNGEQILHYGTRYYYLFSLYGTKFLLRNFYLFNDASFFFFWGAKDAADVSCRR